MRLLIVDDHQVVRRGVRSLLEAENGLHVCGEAVDGQDAIAKAQQLDPDAIVHGHQHAQYERVGCHTRNPPTSP